MSSRYEEVYAGWQREPEAFWAKAAEEIQWYQRWDKVLDISKKPIYRWFSGGVVNTCFNALDHQVENGRGEQLALVYDSPVTETIKRFTYRELLNQTA